MHALQLTFDSWVKNSALGRNTCAFSASTQCRERFSCCFWLKRTFAHIQTSFYLWEGGWVGGWGPWGLASRSKQVNRANLMSSQIYISLFLQLLLPYTKRYCFLVCFTVATIHAWPDIKHYWTTIEQLLNNYWTTYWTTIEQLHIPVVLRTHIWNLKGESLKFSSNSCETCRKLYNIELFNSCSIGCSIVVQ